MPLEAQAAYDTKLASDYPGRGMVIGLSDSGNFLVQLYFLQGRSKGSRGRIFTYDPEVGVIRATLLHREGVERPELLEYPAMHTRDNVHIVTNGDHTDRIYKGLGKGSKFKKIMLKEEREPDAPIFTPRIAAVQNTERGTIHFAKVTAQIGDTSKSDHSFYKRGVEPGIGYVLHTYDGDGKDVQAFSADPYAIKLRGHIEETAQEIWDATNRDNRVALVAKQVHRRTGDIYYVIKNAYGENTSIELPKR